MHDHNVYAIIVLTKEAIMTSSLKNSMHFVANHLYVIKDPLFWGPKALVALCFFILLFFSISVIVRECSFVMADDSIEYVPSYIEVSVKGDDSTYDSSAYLTLDTSKAVDHISTGMITAKVANDKTGVKLYLHFNSTDFISTTGDTIPGITEESSVLPKNKWAYRFDGHTSYVPPKDSYSERELIYTQTDERPDGEETHIYLYVDSTNIPSGIYDNAAYFTAEVFPTEYSVTYFPNSNGDSVTGMPSSYRESIGENTSVTVNLSSAKPVRNNYRFCGWGYRSTTTCANANATSVPLTVNQPAANIYAIWERLPDPDVSVTYKYNTKTVTDNFYSATGITLKTANEVGFSAPNGYVFAGWSTEPNATSSEYIAGSTVYNTLTLYPVWSGNNQITYMDGGIAEIASTGYTNYETQYGDTVFVIDMDGNTWKWGTYSGTEHCVYGKYGGNSNNSCRKQPAKYELDNYPDAFKTAPEVSIENPDSPPKISQIQTSANGDIMLDENGYLWSIGNPYLVGLDHYSYVAKNLKLVSDIEVSAGTIANANQLYRRKLKRIFYPLSNFVVSTFVPLDTPSETYTLSGDGNNGTKKGFTKFGSTKEFIQFAGIHANLLALDTDGYVWESHLSNYDSTFSPLTKFSCLPTSNKYSIYHKPMQKIHMGKNFFAAIQADNGHLWVEEPQTIGGSYSFAYNPEDYSAAGKVFADHKFIDVSGDENMAAVIEDNGHLWTWSSKSVAGIDDGDDETLYPGWNCYTHIACRTPHDLTADSTLPTYGITFRTVDVSTYNIYAIDTDGNFWAWGLNNSGQLGTGNTTASKYPKNISASSNTSFRTSWPIQYTLTESIVAPPANTGDINMSARHPHEVFLYWSTEPHGGGQHYNIGDIIPQSGLTLYANWSPTE